MNDTSPDPESDPDPSGEDDCIERARRQALDALEKPADVHLNRRHASAIETASVGKIPDTIDRYRILGCLGAGGTATVYKAQRDDDSPPVALKVLHSLFTTDELLRRFALEAQLLSNLNHPGIVRVFHSGTHVQGNVTLPYIAMQWIDGIAIDEYAKRHALSVPTRMKLLLKVAGAIKHAHQKSIIHRDLKSANVLVDTHGQPHVVDFGVARLLDSSRQVSTMHTRAGQWLGTLPYMSPEQLGNDPDDVDTRCDVYGLGIIGYELFAGAPPFSPLQYGQAELVHAIRKSTPVPLGKISREYRGDVETIIGKAIEKDRAHRYDTVAELASDLTRSIDNEPILARRTSPLEKLFRWHRREPIVSGLCGALVLASFALVMTVVIGWQRSVAFSQQRRIELYAAEMNLASQAYRINDAATIRRFLLRQTPAPGESDLRGFEWYFLWNQVHGERYLLHEHLGPVHDVAFSPDAKWMASCGMHRIVIWDTASWKPAKTIEQPSAGFNVVRFSADSRMLASGDDDRMCCVWSVPDGVEIARLKHQTPVQCLAFSADSTRLVVGEGDYDVYLRYPGLGFLTIWDLETQTKAWFSEEKMTSVTSVHFVNDETQLVAAHANDVARLWTPATSTTATIWEAIGQVDVPHVSVARLSPDGDNVAISGWGDRIALWDFNENRIVRSIAEERVQQLAFSADGSTLATLAYRNLPVNLRDSQTGEVVDRLYGHAGDVRAVAFSPDGKWIVTAGQDQKIRVWSAEQDHAPRRIPNSTGEIDAMSFNQDETLMALGNRRGEVRVIDVSTGDRIYESQRLNTWIEAAELSPDGRTLVIGAKFSPPVLEPTNTIDVIDIESDATVASLDQPGREPAKIAYSADSKRLAIGFHKSTLNQVSSSMVVYDTRTWLPLWSFDTGTIGVQAVAFSPDAKTLLTGSDDGLLRLWDADSGKPLCTGERFAGSVTDVKFSADGQWIAAGSWARPELGRPSPEVRICRADSLATVHRLLGHVGGVYGVGFSPNGTTLVSGGGGGVVKLWDVQSGRQRAELQTAGTGWVFNVHFSSDGNRLFATYGSNSEHGGVNIWDAPKSDRLPEKR